MKNLILIVLFVGCIFAVYQNLTGFLVCFGLVIIYLIFKFISYAKTI